MTSQLSRFLNYMQVLPLSALIFVVAADQRRSVVPFEAVRFAA